MPEPPATRKNDVRAWQTAVSNAESQISHQQNRYTVSFIQNGVISDAFSLPRIDNLELMSQYGANAWKVHTRFGMMNGISPLLSCSVV